MQRPAALLRKTLIVRALTSPSRAMKLDDLRDIVNAQRDNINTPLPLKFKTYKANKPTLIDILLDPAYGFATRKPRLSFVPGFGVQKGAKRRKTAGAAATSKATPLVPDNQAGHSSDAMLNSAVCCAVPSLLLTRAHSVLQGMSMSGTTNYPSQGMNTFDVFMSNGGAGAGMSDVAGFDSSAFSGVPAMTFDGLYSFTSSSMSTEVCLQHPSPFSHPLMILGSDAHSLHTRHTGCRPGALTRHGPAHRPSIP